jgi:hypothetical protein
MHSPLRVSNLEEMTLVAWLIDVNRVLWTLAHDVSNDGIDYIIRRFFQRFPPVQVCDETTKTVLIAVPVDPMSAIRRLVVDGGFHHRSIRKMWLKAGAPSALSAEGDGKNFGKSDCHPTIQTVQPKGQKASPKRIYRFRIPLCRRIVQGESGQHFSFLSRDSKMLTVELIDNRVAEILLS